MHDQFHVPDKDPAYIYRWCNTDERAMLHRKSQGYEVVIDDKPELPTVVTGATDGPTTRRRGQDLVLCRIKKEAFEANVESRRRALREHHAAANDLAIEGLDKHTRAELQARYGKKQKQLVFRTSDGPGFGDQL